MAYREILARSSSSQWSTVTGMPRFPKLRVTARPWSPVLSTMTGVGPIPDLDTITAA